MLCAASTGRGRTSTSVESSSTRRPMAIRTRITPVTRLPFAAPRLKLVTGGVGVLATLYFARLLALQGFTTKLQAVVGLIIFVALVLGFVAVPWVMVAAAIPFFALLPTL